MIAFSRYAVRAGAAAGLLAAVSACSAGQASRAPAPAPATQVHQNVVYGRSAGGTPLTEDVYSPTADTAPGPVVIIVNGGSFTSGVKLSFSTYASALAEVGYLTVNVDYSPATPHGGGYPKQVQDIERAIQWSVAHARQFGGDPRRIALVGFSDGAYLSAMAGLLDSDLPGRPVKAVVTLSAPLDLPALYQLFVARLAVCGTLPSCPQVPNTPSLSAYGPLFTFLGCSPGFCQPQTIQEASPSSHITARAPAFLIFNSANEVVPSSQASDMGNLLRAARVPEQVVIVPGSSNGVGYLPTASPAILKFLGQQLGLPQQRLAASAASSTPVRSTDTLDLLVACCALVAAGSLGGVVVAVRRQWKAR
jgi:acetyl esterase/lipase